MSDTSEPFYRMVACSHGKMSSHMAPDESSYLATSRCEGGYPEPVGEFVTRPWCKTHDAELLRPTIDHPEPECLRFHYMPPEYKKCVPTDEPILFQVIPDDH